MGLAAKNVKGENKMSINQLYGEILGNTKDVTWEESDTINYWYERAINGQPIVGYLSCVVICIYEKRTMNYRDHIVRAILETY